MNVAPLLQGVGIALITAMLSACVGGGGAYYDNQVGAMNFQKLADDTAGSGNLGATNKSVGGKPLQFSIADQPGKTNYKSIVVSGASANSAGKLLDVWMPSAKASGSILGFRVNQAMKVTVASKDFVPQPVVLEGLNAWPNKEKMDYYQASTGAVVSSAGGMNIAVATYREPKDKVRDGAQTYSLIVGVLSADGRSGSYTVKVEYVN